MIVFERWKEIVKPGNDWLIILCLIATACQQRTEKNKIEVDSITSCMNIPPRFGKASDSTHILFSGDTSTIGMVLIKGGEFNMGGDNEQASEDEYPKHRVRVSSFYMDETEVTNAQFKKFVEATGYVTTAERKPDWEELKKSIPPGTPKPHDSLLVAASLVFKPSNGPVNLNDYSQWWSWVSGADWKHPQGPKSSIQGKDNYPVVQVSWDDAVAYCKWAGKRLPTEAEWEYAARGALVNNIYPWGNEHVNAGNPKANSWEGKFPYYNERKDGFVKLAPTKSFLPNGYGLYDMAGNVWEWCSDWYGPYPTNAQEDPQGPDSGTSRVLRGGSLDYSPAYLTSSYRDRCTPGLRYNLTLGVRLVLVAGGSAP